MVFIIFPLPEIGGSFGVNIDLRIDTMQDFLLRLNLNLISGCILIPYVVAFL